MQSIIFYQANFLSYLKISIFVKALVNGLALLLDFPVTSLISIHVLSVACLNYIIAKRSSEKNNHIILRVGCCRQPQ